MIEDRQRYEQRLSLFMSNPESKESSVHSVDVASKVEIQRLGQELSIATNSLAVAPQKEENEEMKESLMEKETV